MASKGYQLLSVDQDAKTIKGKELGYETGILYLAPALESGTGIDMCGFRTEEYTKACIYGQGMSAFFPSIKAARIEKTKWYVRDYRGFAAAMQTDIDRLRKQAKREGLTPCVRCNGTSDQPKLARELAKRNPDVQFYDYTKIPKPWKRELANYKLTFSFSGENLSDCMDALDHGCNVAVVFAGGLPETWRGYPVVDGDKSDLRFLDGKGVIVGLSPKGTAKKMAVGSFIQIGRVA